MLISAFIIEAHTIAKSKGWHERPLCSDLGMVHDFASVNVDAVGAVIGLIHSELSEAFDEYSEGWTSMYFNGDKPEGLPIELADVLIRIGDLAGALGITTELTASIGFNPTLADLLHARSSWDDLDVYKLLLVAHANASKSLEALRKRDATGVIHYLAKTINATVDVFVVAGASPSLPEAIAIKMDYNRMRPHRHGDKAL